MASDGGIPLCERQFTRGLLNQLFLTKHISGQNLSLIELQREESQDLAVGIILLLDEPDLFELFTKLIPDRGHTRREGDRRGVEVLLGCLSFQHRRVADRAYSAPDIEFVAHAQPERVAAGGRVGCAVFGVGTPDPRGAIHTRGEVRAFAACDGLGLCEAIPCRTEIEVVLQGHLDRCAEPGVFKCNPPLLREHRVSRLREARR